MNIGFQNVADLVERQFDSRIINEFMKHSRSLCSLSRKQKCSIHVSYPRHPTDSKDSSRECGRHLCEAESYDAMLSRIPLKKNHRAVSPPMHRRFPEHY